MPLADDLSHDDVISAIADFESGTIDHRFAASEKFDLLADDGRRFPPKAIAALATRHKTGELPTPDEFTGGADSSCFRILRKAGFQVVPKSGLIPFKVGSKYSRKRIGDYLGTSEDTTKGDWATGYHLHRDPKAGIDGWWFLFPTVGDSARTGHEYSNEWISGTMLRWEGKTSSQRGQPQIESLLSGDYPVLVFSRNGNRDDFTFHGLGSPVRVEEKVPVRVEWSVDLAETVVRTLDDETAEADTSGYVAKAEDQRERVLREIRARRGQQEFRSVLLDAFGRRCAISGCDVVGVLEAAHLRPYRGANDNDPSNGLLLRSDIHTLFDLNLLGIEPRTLIVRLHSSVRRPPYDQFDGVKVRNSQKLSQDAVLYRWQQFLSAEGS
jgi:hypothetical protein